MPALPSASLLHIFHQPFRADLGAEDVAVAVGGNAFRGAGAGDLLDRVRNQRGHFAGARVADADTAFPARIAVAHRLRFRVGDIDRVVAVDEDAARTAELLPLGDEFAFLVEDLDAVVVAVADEEAALRVHRQRVRNVEFARAGALLAPGLD